MRIIDRKTFLAMPPETLFCKYEPCVMDELLIKGDSIFFDGGDDFFCQSIEASVDCDDPGEFIEILDDALSFGKSFALNLDLQHRDGCFDKDQFFMVFEKADVAALIARLQRCA